MLQTHFVTYFRKKPPTANVKLMLGANKYYHFQESGVVIIAGIGESTDDADDSDVEEVDHHRPVSPCRVSFVGANVVYGKSSLRSKPKSNKVI